ncbi:MAG: MFS transporter [Phycisphaerales bacterium]|nr:MFS transporter [Phycisphaerales bacterium]
MSEERINRTQWKALIAAWLGWAFDGLDGYLYLLVSGPLVRQLLERHSAGPVEQKEVIGKAALIQAVFLVGWAVGGAVFGRLGDRIGRSRTLTLTVLTYAVFTGLSAFAGAWWHLLIFRFIAALGIGGEWAAGSALVSEILHRRHRAWASATLQSGYMIGCICASLTVKAFAAAAVGLNMPALGDPRWVFLVGVLPALLTVWIRYAVPEPEHWKEAARGQVHPPVSALFSRALRRTTLLMMALTSIALTTVWAFLYFGPPIIRAMPEVKAWDARQVNHLVSNVTIVYLLVNIIANYFATYLAKFIGYRRAFAFLMAASLASFLIAFSQPLSLGSVYWKFSLVAFFALGLFGLFPLYIPPLFPTLVRTLGAGFTYNVGRLVAAAGTFAGGAIATSAGGELRALYYVGFLFVAGFVVALVIPEPHGEEDVQA